MRTDLQARAVAALTGSGVTSAKLASLIEETEATISEAEASAEKAHQRALDPIASPNPQRARAQMEDAAFLCARLRSLLPRLQARYDRLLSTEDRKRWKREYEVLKVERDALATELTETYPQAVTKLIDLFARIAAMDVEISNLHHSRPAGVPLHLASVELEARGLDRFSTTNPSIAKELRLPAWEAGVPALWPPPEVPLALAATAFAPAAHAGPDWFRNQEARAQAERADAVRVAQYYAQEQRDRERNVSTP